MNHQLVNDALRSGSVPDPASEDSISVFAFEIESEARRASQLHAPMNSHHEAYAVILEELDEYWDEVKKKREERDPENIRTELIQTAAMCLRTLVDL